VKKFKILSLGISLSISSALFAGNYEQSFYDKQARLTEVKKQDYITELSGTNQIKWFFWMTKSGRVFIADTRTGEDANSITLWEHSLSNFTWTPISGGSVEKIFDSISLSNDGRSITLSSTKSSAITSISNLTISSSSFTNGGVIPTKYACTYNGGSNISPQLTWRDAPKETSTFAIIMDDETSPCGFGDSACVHWGLFNIPSNTMTINESQSISSVATEGSIYTYDGGYYGPCPPFNHTYKTTIYALSKDMPDIISSSIFDSYMTRSQFKSKYGSYILQESTISGTFGN